MQNFRSSGFDRAPASAAGVPSALCPGCGQAVDPLRAGHVAALEGRGFHYFCRASCKQEFLRASGRPQEEDVPTAAPPEVSYALDPANDADRLRTVPPSSSVQSRTVPPSSVQSRTTLPSIERAPPTTRAHPPELDAPASSASSAPAVSAIRSAQAVDPRAVFPSAPPDGRSTLPSGRPAAAEKASARRVPVAPAAPRRSDGATAVIDGLGIVAGVLAPAIGLLGAVADVARVPLVVFAWAALALRVQRSRRDPSDPHVLVVLAPAGAAVAAAWWAQAVSDPRAVAIAVFAGLACAVAIVVETTVGRSRERVHAAREAVERALDVRVRAVPSWSRGAAGPLELPGDDTIEMPATDMRPGEPIVVEAGEVVGVDAIVTAGEARVVPWLGARVEVVRREGDPLVAGARVVSSRLRMTTTWSGRERAWVKLLSVPAARIDVAAPTARALRHTVERGVPIAALLVGLATMANGARPVEVLAAMAAASMAFGAKALVSLVGLHFARAHLEALASGITYKDPRTFERAGSANIAVLSARGTVLLGEPEIVAVEPIGPGADAGDEEVARVLSLAAGAETASTHPFAAAILRAARTRAARADDVRNATVHAGLGVTALASTGERLVVGGRAIMLSEKIGVAAVDGRVTDLEGQGRSVLLVALGDRLVGLISLQDGLRAGARAAVQRLLDARIEPVLLSGEARDTCETIGRALDIEHVRPAVLPADRGPEVRALGEGGSVIAVIGHAISDDAALGAADVAVAMGAAGSTPGEWAVALASDDVRDAAMALAIPHATRARVRVAMALGAIPGLVALLAVGFGVAPLAIAPLAALVGAVAVAVHARESV
ncbi:MAG TPA: HAD family hydrolase [Polyangiaceae bacterium]|nr:HAD family hydrolase [Polyangiaceae bacterium]